MRLRYDANWQQFVIRAGAPLLFPGSMEDGLWIWLFKHDLVRSEA